MILAVCLCLSQGNQSLNINWTNIRSASLQCDCQSSGVGISSLEILVRWSHRFGFQLYGSHLIFALSGNNNNESFIDCLLCARHFTKCFVCISPSFVPLGNPKMNI